MASEEPLKTRNSNTQLLEELEALSQTLYQSHTRRTASLALPRTSLPPLPSSDEFKPSSKPRSRRMSLSPFRSRSKLHEQPKLPVQSEVKNLDEKLSASSSSAEKKGIWNWKPIRALSHIGMQKLSCLFSVEVVAVQGLPASMNGLRLSVCVRKKETKDGAVQTMPSRVSQGAADFEETLFLRCHVYCNSGQGKQMKYEPRPFLIYVFAVDAEELDFGRSSVDLTKLIQESVERSNEGGRVRQWDTAFSLSGKAKGGELLLKLGFQIMEKDGGVGIYSQGEGLKPEKSKFFPSSFARKQSKNSFSVPSPRIPSRNMPSKVGTTLAEELQGLDDFNLDEPAPASSASTIQKQKETALKIDDYDMPDFEVVDKGVEFQDKEESREGGSDGTVEERSVSSEVVKEIVHDPIHLNRLSELDSISQQIKALEAMIAEEKVAKSEGDTESQRLDAEEENITREFLQMLEDKGLEEFKSDQAEKTRLQFETTKASDKNESNVYIPDLGKGLGCAVQTRNGGFLVAMNPLDTAVSRKDTPKMAMQMSKPLVISSYTSMNGFELFQKMAATGLDELSSQILSLMPIDELTRKTAEQIAFEGMASAIIQGRKKEGANSSAARTIAAVKTMATAMSTGRKDRILSGLWYVDENPLTVEEILAFSLQKIEGMAIEALKIQADMAEEEAPFDVSPLSVSREDQDHPLASAVPLEDWVKNYSLDTSEGEPGDLKTITLAVVVQLRDPIRRYEAVGGPLIILIQATHDDFKAGKYIEEMRFKVASLHVGGLKVRAGGKRIAWDAEKQRLTARQWLVAYGFGKAGKKGKYILSKGQDMLWSISSRIMADMWLKAIRNPNIKLQK